MTKLDIEKKLFDFELPKSRSQKQSEYAKIDKDKINKRRRLNRKYQKEIYPENVKLYDRWQHLYSSYKITLVEYNKLLKQQNYVCAICKQYEIVKLYNKIKPLHVDHCHKTNKIRGLLCHACNTMIARAKDNPLYLRNAADYLEQNEEDNYIFGY